MRPLVAPPAASCGLSGDRHGGDLFVWSLTAQFGRRADGRGPGNPRWTTCALHCWTSGSVERSRSARRQSGRVIASTNPLPWCLVPPNPRAATRCCAFDSTAYGARMFFDANEYSLVFVSRFDPTLHSSYTIQFAVSASHRLISRSAAPHETIREPIIVSVRPIRIPDPSQIVRSTSCELDRRDEQRVHATCARLAARGETRAAFGRRGALSATLAFSPWAARPGYRLARHIRDRDSSPRAALRVTSRKSQALSIW